jgi:solute carrier family 25 (mitochondrial folate transporter), member 32
LGLNDSLFNIYNSCGVTGLYTGLSANLIGNASSWGMYFYLYRIYKGWLKSDYGFGENFGNFSASAMAGLSTIIFTNPIWVVKTKMCRDIQLKRPFIQVLKSTFQKDGIAGLYRGIVPGVFGIVQSSVQMSLYESIKRNYKPDSPLEFVLASSSSKILAILLTYPYQVAKSRMQASNHPFLEVCGEIAREKAFYRGIVPATLRVLPGTAITFATYETILKILGHSSTCK